MKKRALVSVILVLGLLLVGSVFAVQSFRGQRRHVISGNLKSKITSNQQFIGDLDFGHPNSEIIVNIGGAIGTLAALYDDLEDTENGTSPANYAGHPIRRKTNLSQQIQFI